MTPDPNRFILCADDYAMTPGVSRGILRALDAQAINATSVMTTSPWWPESAAALSAHAGHTSLGLHVNLTLGAPLGPSPRLAPQGQFPAIGAYLRGGPLPLAEIETEIDRQIEAFVAVMGRAPDHVDGHQHVHALPSIAPLVLRQLRRRDFAGKLWLRDSADRLSRIITRGSALKKAAGLAWITRGFAALAQASGFQTNQGFAGFSNFRAGDDYAEQFARYLVRPGPRHLVMCHPGYVDDALRRLDPVTDSRERELAFLLSPKFQIALERSGMRLEHQRPGGA